MSKRIFNSGTAPHTQRSLADVTTVLPHTRRARTLVALLEHGPMVLASLMGRSGESLTAKRPEYQRLVLEPLRLGGFIVYHGGERLGQSELTPAGARLAAKLRHEMNPDADAAELDARVATGRQQLSAAPMPRGDYRCPRPGAYDFQRHPSRYGSRRVFRDGSVEHVDSAAAEEQAA